MGGRGEDFTDIISVLHLQSAYAAAAFLLCAQIRRINALNVILLGQGNGHGLVGNKVGHIHIAQGCRNFRTAFVPEIILFVSEFRFDYPHDFLPAGQQIAEVGDGFLHILVIRFNLISFQTGQTAETHIKNGDCLFFRQTEFGNQRRLRHLIGPRFTDGADDFVNMIKGNEQTFQNMGFGFCLFQFIAASSRDNFFLMFQIVVKNLLQVENTWMPVDERQHDGTEIDLHLGMLVQVVQHDLRIHIRTQLDNDAHAASIRFITECRDAVNDFLAGQVGNHFHQARLIHLVRQFRHNDTVLPAFHFFDIHSRADGDGTAARAVGIFNAFMPLDNGRRREIGPFDIFHQFINGDFRIINHRAKPVHHFRQVVGRHVRRHTYGDTVRTVDEQVRYTGRQHKRFCQRAVIVRHEVNRVFINITEHFQRDFRHTHFRITHRRRRIAVNRTEVAVTVYQRITDGEILRHADSRIINRRIAVGVVLT